MAQGYYEKLYKQLSSDRQKAEKKIYNETMKGKQAKVQKQIDNKTTRLKNSGVEVEEDNRNWFEKWAGLPEDQNFIFDFFELLGRPQQALFGAINAAQNGEDVGDAAWEHFKGDKQTNFKKILTDAGMEDEEGKLDFADVLGFVGDVVADPLDLALIPATGGASIAGKVTDAAGDTAKAISKGVKVADDVVDTAKSGVKLKSVNDLVFEGLGKGIKGGVKLTDKGLEKALNKIDNLKGISYTNLDANAAANLGKVLSEGTKEGTKGSLELYKGLKDEFAKKFNFSKNISKDVSKGIRENQANEYKAALELDPLRKELDTSLENYAKKEIAKGSTEKIDDIINKADKDILNLKEYENLDRTTDANKVLRNAMKDKATVEELGNNGLEVLKKAANNVNDADLGIKLDINVVDNKIKLEGDWQKAIDDGLIDIDELKNTEIKKLTSYTKEQEKELKELSKRLKTDEDFKKLYDETNDIFNKANKIVNDKFGVNLKNGSENMGYVRHGIDKEKLDSYNKLFDKTGKYNILGETGTIANTSTLKRREFEGSILEANNYYNDTIRKSMDSFNDAEKKVAKELIDGGLFKEGMRASFDEYLENIPKLAKNSKDFDTVMVKATFGDYKELKNINEELKKAEVLGDTEKLKELNKMKTEKLNNSNIKLLTEGDREIPYGYSVLRSGQVEEIAEKMDTLGKQLGVDEMKEVSKFIKKNGNSVAINNELLRLVSINTDKKSINAFTRLYDKYLGTFKKFKTLSPSFQMNNIAGNMSNMYLSGMSPTQIAKLYPESLDIFVNGDKLMRKAANGAKLTEKEQKIVKVWSGFIDEMPNSIKGLTAMELNEMPESLRKYFNGEKSFKDMTKTEKVKEFLPYINNKANNFFDTLSRLTVYNNGLNNPKYLRNLGVETAGDAVRKVLFDPSELTSFEQNTMKRIMPFYTFTKKNLAFQLNNLSKNGANYKKLLKGYNRLLEDATGGNEDNVEDWLRNNMYIPIPALGEDGSYKVLRTQLPFGNVIDTFNDPLGVGTSLVSPLLKMPIELASNKNSFTGADIEKFAGQKSTNIPLLTKRQEYLLGGLTGLDVPLKTVNNIANNGVSGLATLSGNIDSDKLSKMYDRLDELETLMQQYKQKGYEFSTMAEIKQANKNAKTESIMANLNKLKGIKENPYSKMINKKNY